MARVRIHSRKDFAACFLFLLFGLFTLSQIGPLQIGTLTHMGPGYFPMILAVLLIGIGIIGMVRALRHGDAGSTERVPLVPVLFVTAGVVAFGFLIERAGLVAAIFGLILFICYDQLRPRPLQTLALFVLIAAMSVALFIYGLGLPIAAY